MKHVLMLVWKVIFYIILNFTICMLILPKYIKYIKLTQFQCHCPLHDPSPKAVMSDMLHQHQNWYIQKDVSGSLRISHWNQSKLIVHCYKAVLPWDSESCCLLTRPQEGSTCTLRKIFWWPLWVALLKNQEYTAKWFFSGVLSQLFLREFPQ